MISKNLSEIKKEDILALVTQRIAELTTLDYKEKLPGNKDTDKKEFLSDVASFANAAGGNIIYGISEDRDENGKTTGKPQVASGPGSINLDQEILRLEQMIRDGISPRVDFVMKPVEGFLNGPIVILRIRKSWHGPAMVTYQGASLFYSRGSNGKYRLDYQQIRSSFLAGEETSKKLKGFRVERSIAIEAGETPMRLVKHQ